MFYVLEAEPRLWPINSLPDMKRSKLLCIPLQNPEKCRRTLNYLSCCTINQNFRTRNKQQQ